MVNGSDEGSANVGAELILSRRKTATSALPADFEGVGQRPRSPAI